MSEGKWLVWSVFTLRNYQFLDACNSQESDIADLILNTKSEHLPLYIHPYIAGLS